MKNSRKVASKRINHPEKFSWSDMIPSKVRPSDHEIKLIQNSDYPNFMEELKSIRTGLADMELKRRVSLARNLASAYNVAKRLERDFFAWSDFLAGDWGDLRKPKVQEQKKNALKHVLRWLCGPTKDGQKKASFYNRALGPLFESDLTAHSIRMKIHYTGLRKLADQHAASKQKKPKFDYMKPVEKNKRWCVTMDVEFDIHPHDLIGLTGQIGFEMTGRVLETAGKRMKVLGWRFKKTQDFS
ncbi:hypothetical protein [Rhizobium sp. NZLR1]|uniref:hypothetical protein n=1 Tax=Rhizobium sp. NZLR1 TaxID=2731096 RepID=UPI001A993B53|nr:hypothetical protein [Rhizobium sp. NZLR1]MBX5201027.1 hypothetical protein [Rhizobium sp. NZLR1]QSZ21542.1 hypothetical protein J3O30_02945 [Rhizobium sp. NZLR1]